MEGLKKKKMELKKIALDLAEIGNFGHFDQWIWN